MKKISKMDGVLYVEPNYYMEIAKSSNDEFNNEQLSYFDLINLYDAWDLTTGSKNVKVGIIDTGIDRYHPDLVNQIDPELCYDFVNTTTGDYSDSCGHGTHVAGIIGAQGNNHNGVSGICWDVTIVALKVAETTQGELVDVIQAINYAEDHDLDIINISMSKKNPTFDLINSLTIAINSFSGLVVVAAGSIQNDESGSDLNNDLNSVYPANFNLPNLITVAGSTEDDEISAQSYYGATRVDICAPGEAILSTYPTGKCENYSDSLGQHKENGYHYMDGSSMAAPIVTGVAALMLSKSPNLRPEEIKHIILNAGSDYIIDLEDFCVDGRRINAFDAVEHASRHNRNMSNNYTYCDNFTCNATYCRYTVTEYHNKYVYNAGGDNYYIKCYNCDYTYQICESPEYWNNGDSGHTVACPDGCYTFTEGHSPVSYLQTSSIYTHTAFCGDCSSAYNDAHTWITISGTYRYQCTKCLLLSNQAPNIQQSLPPEIPETDGIPDNNETE